MRYVLLIFMLRAAFGDADYEYCPPWAQQQYLKDYQDAWKTLNQTNTTRYFLLMSTYSSNPPWGENFTCVNVRAVNVYTNHTVESLFTFKNASGYDKIYNVTDMVGVTKTYGYQTWNAIQYTLPNGTKINDTIIFSDYQKCDVISVPYENNGLGCELWVNEKYVNEPPLCCQYIFDTFCRSAGDYMVYKKDNCSDVLEPQHAEVGC